MTMRFTLVALGVSATLAACSPPSSASDSTSTTADQRCKALVGKTLGSATIESAKPVRRGTQLIGFVKRTIVKTFIWSDLPEFKAAADFCRVTATLRPVPQSEITVQIWLPHEWNGKLLGTGGSGVDGGLAMASVNLSAPLAKGYVAFATDAGHKGLGTAKFAHDSQQQYVDYAYQASHVATIFAKTLISTYYGTPAKRAYFYGCSNGGRDALMEARRFPDDYDAIVAGAPAAGWSKLVTAYAWNHQATRGTPKLGDKLKLIQDAVIAKCDTLDGVKDGLLENPMNCRFDPAELQCTDKDSPSCLNPDEVAVVRKVYGGPRLSDGTPIYPGPAAGGEALEKNWDHWVIASRKSVSKGIGVDAIRWMAYGDPEWGLDDFDVDKTYPLLRERVAPVMDADDPSLGEFIGRGGKLLLYHGWNDGAIPPRATLDYHAALRESLGPAADRQVRLFMIPGLMHCIGGAGTTYFDLLDEIDRWATGGVAPERIVATEYDPAALFGPAPGAKVVRTRPLCPWPKVARYNGSGSTDEASNFTCR